jgi:hypothetical protein
MESKMEDRVEYHLVKVECTDTTNDLLAEALARANSGIEPRRDFHCTVLCARDCKTAPTTLSQVVAGQTQCHIHQVVKMSDGKAVAAVLCCPQFESRNTELLKETGGVEDYRYLAHVTLGYQTSPLTSEQDWSLNEALVGLLLKFDRETTKVLQLRAHT